MTDPTPQAEQEWFCVSCNHPHTMHQNVPNGQSCHCGGCTAWVPELRPAEPSPAPPAVTREMVEEAYRELYPAERVIEVAPQEEIPDTVILTGEQFREMQSALTAVVEERDRARDALRGFVDGVINKCVDGRLTMNVSFEAFKRAEAIVYPAALKPVSDRQPEGETK